VHISSMTDTETTNWEGNHEKSIGKWNGYHWPSESALSLAFGSITPPRTNFDPDVLSPLNDSTNSAYTRAASSSSLLTYRNQLNQMQAKYTCREKTNGSAWENYKGAQTLTFFLASSFSLWRLNGTFFELIRGSANHH
jgi:hypothetical protein